MDTQFSIKLAALIVAVMLNVMLMAGVAALFSDHDSSVRQSEAALPLTSTHSALFVA
jgi:hypothetical protein